VRLIWVCGGTLVIGLIYLYYCSFLVFAPLFYLNSGRIVLFVLDSFYVFLLYFWLLLIFFPIISFSCVLDLYLG
jgi:hypothetical protein